MAGDRLEHRLVGSVADALALDGEVEKSLGADVCLVPEFRDDHGTTARPIETFQHGIVESFQRDRPDASVPDDFRNKPHDGHNDIGDHIELPMANTPKPPTPLFSERAGWYDFVLDSNCIAWMFEMSISAVSFSKRRGTLTNF